MSKTRTKNQPGGLHNLQIIVNKMVSPGDADCGAVARRERERGRYLSYSTNSGNLEIRRARQGHRANLYQRDVST